MGARHRHKWKLVADSGETQTLHLDTFKMTHEVYERFQCRCGKAKIMSRPITGMESNLQEDL